MTSHQASERERAAEEYFRAMSTARLDERSGSGELPARRSTLAPWRALAEGVEAVAADRVA